MLNTDRVTVVVRPLEIDDYDQMIALWRRSPGVGLSSADERDSITRFMERNPGGNFGVWHEQELVGTVLTGNDGRRGYLYHLAVDPRHQRRGIGSALASAALDSLRAEGIEKSHLFVYRNNRVAERFWKRTGWVKRREISIFSKDVRT